MDFGAANFTVLGLYLAAMLAIGCLAGRRIKSTRSFFIADGRLNHVLVGISILGTYLSALTMMGLPGISYGAHDWTFMVQLPFLIITAAVITRWILPQYRDAGVTSIYAFMERRLGVTARLVGAVSFIIFAIGRMGLVLYLPALAFSTATGASLPSCIIIMGIIITLYTVVGGIEAVIWTDAIQVVIFVMAAIFTLVYIMGDVGTSQFIAVGLEHRKFRLLIPGTDIFKITSVWLVLETIFQTIRIYGTQQDIAQRYMTTGSTKKANRSVWISVLAYIPLGFLFYVIGTALFVFFKCHPEAALPGKSDSVYPFFVVNHLPAGVAGLVIAAIFAAAMSSIDSCMNSASTVCVEDFIKRFSRTKGTDENHLLQARALTILWGVMSIVLGILFMKTEYVLIVWGKLMGISTNGILGLMLIAFMGINVRWWAVAGGVVLSYACLFSMMYSGITYLLWPVAGNIVCFAATLLLNGLGGNYLRVEVTLNETGHV